MIEGPLQPVVTWVDRTLAQTYRVTRCIGEGGMGAVYEAQHVRLPLRFAVKVLTRTRLRQTEAVQRFRREAELASQLKHRHVVEIVDYNTTESGEPYIVMEYLEGETLAERLARRGRLSLEQTLSVVRQVGAALAAAHRQGIIHRDLKPQNVFLCRQDDRDDYVKVLDFGISKLLGSTEALTDENMLLGTPAYVSPEQVRGKPAEIDARSDIFALAAIVYEMLTGKITFAGHSPVNVLHRVVHEDPTPLRALCPELPEALEPVLARALAKYPAERYPDVAELCQALERASGLPVDEEGWAKITTSRPISLVETLPPEPRSAGEIAHASTIAGPSHASAATPRTGPGPAAATTATTRARLAPLAMVAGAAVVVLAMLIVTRISRQTHAPLPAGAPATRDSGPRSARDRPDQTDASPTSTVTAASSAPEAGPSRPDAAASRTVERPRVPRPRPRAPQVPAPVSAGQSARPDAAAAPAAAKVSPPVPVTKRAPPPPRKGADRKDWIMRPKIE